MTLEYSAKSTMPYGISWKALPRNVGHVFDWMFRRRGLFSSTTGEGGAFLSTVPGVERPDIQLFFCTGRANTQAASGFTGHGFLMHVCQLRPGSIGRLSLKSADPADKPSILYNFFRGDSTMKVLRDGIRIARKIMSQPRLSRRTWRPRSIRVPRHKAMARSMPSSASGWAHCSTRSAPAPWGKAPMLWSIPHHCVSMASRACASSTLRSCPGSFQPIRWRRPIAWLKKALTS